MPQARDEAGNIWEVDAQGNPIALVSQAGQQMPADPSYPYQGTQAQAESQRAQAQAQTAQAEAPYAGTLASAQARKAEAEAEIARLNAEAQAEERKESSSPASRIRSGIKTDETIDRISAARDLASEAMTTGNVFGTGLFQYVPLAGQDSANLGAKLEGLKGGVINDMLQELKQLSDNGSSGYGSFTQTEADRLAASIASLQQTQDAPSLVAELDRLERHYRVGRAILEGQDPRQPEVAERYGLTVDDSGNLNLPTGRNGPRGDGGYRIGVDEAYATEQDKRFAALVQSAFNRGASAEELNALNRQYGYPEYNPEELAQAIKFRDEGGEGVEVRAPESGRNDPSILERGIQNLAASPLGTYFGQAGNALSLGTLDELGGIARGDSISDAFGGTGVNTNEINLQKSLQSEANPTAALLGNVSGGIIGALGGGAALGAGKAVGSFAPRALAGDAAFGAAFGAGEDNDNRLGGAALGAVAGAGGGALGRGAMAAAGRAIGGVQGSARDLYQKGIRLTPGQIGEGINQSTPGGSTFGRYLKGREDRLSGYSGIGDAIGGAQTRGLQDFNRAAFREGIREVPPGLGEEAVDYANDIVVPGAYGRALDGRQFTPDQQFEQGLIARMGEAEKLPALGSQTQYQLERSISPFIDEADTISGRNMQKMTQELQRRGARLDRSADADGPDAAAILAAARDDIGGMVERQAPGVMGDFQEANTIFRNTKILEDAVGRGMNTDGVFTPAQLGMAAKQNAKKYGGRYASQDRPFFDLQRAAQNILPSKVPDSGTAGREAAGDGLLGSAKAFARNLRTPIYSDTAIDMINTIAFERPELLRSIGDVVVKNRRKAGLFGSPLSVYAVSD